MPRPRFFFLFALLSACTPLPIVEPGCGNGVIEPELGETCDAAEASCGTPAGPAACKRLCALGPDCPDGYACGADGVCRAPTGSVTLAQTFDRGFLRLATTDLDGDGRGDIVGVSTADSGTGHPLEVLFSEPAGFFDTVQLSGTPIPMDPVTRDLDGDGIDDLLTSAGPGLDVRRGTHDRSLVRDLLFVQPGASLQPTPPLGNVTAIAPLAIPASPSPALGFAALSGTVLRVYDSQAQQVSCVEGLAGAVDPRHLAAVDLLATNGVSSVGQATVVFTEEGSHAIRQMAPSGASCVVTPLAQISLAQKTLGRVFGTRVAAPPDKPDTVVVVPVKGLNGAAAPPYALKAGAFNVGDPAFTATALDAGFPSESLLAVGDLGHDGTVDAIAAEGLIVCTKNPILLKDECAPVVSFTSDPAVEAFVLDGFAVGLPDVVVRHASGVVNYFNAVGPKSFAPRKLATGATALGTTDVNGDGLPDVVIATNGPAGRRLTAAFSDPIGFPGELAEVAKLPADPLMLVGNLEAYGVDGFSDLAIALPPADGGPIPDLGIAFGFGSDLASPFVAFDSPKATPVIEAPYLAAAGSSGGVTFVATLGAVLGAGSQAPLSAVVGNVDADDFGLSQVSLPLDVGALGPVTDDPMTALATLATFHGFTFAHGEDDGALFVLWDGAKTQLRGVVGVDQQAAAKVVAASGDYQVVDAVAGDLDGNETPELVLLTRVYAGDGTFTSQLRVFGDAAVAAWLDGAQELQQTDELDLGGGFDPRTIAVLDLDGDRAFREVLVNGLYDPEAPSLRAQQVTGLGRGLAKGAADYNALPWGATDMAAGDFDADGIEDLVVSNADPDNGYDYAAIYLGTFL